MRLLLLTALALLQPLIFRLLLGLFGPKVRLTTGIKELIVFPLLQTETKKKERRLHHENVPGIDYEIHLGSIQNRPPMKQGLSTDQSRMSLQVAVALNPDLFQFSREQQELLKTLGDHEVLTLIQAGYGVAYIGTHDQNVYAADSQSGAKLWSHPTRDHVYSSPAITNGVLYLGSEDQRVYAFHVLGKIPSPRVRCRVVGEKYYREAGEI
jgi:hypothetical protein